MTAYILGQPIDEVDDDLEGVFAPTEGAPRHWPAASARERRARGLIQHDGHVDSAPTTAPKAARGLESRHSAR